MVAAVIAAGVLAQAAMGWFIAARRVRFWPGTSVIFAILGVAAVLVRPAGSFELVWIGVGAGSGVVLYGATRIAVGLLARMSPFASSVTEVYGRSEEIPRTAVWVLTLAIAIPGEELFWRGLVLRELQHDTAVVLGAILAWLGYVVVNAASRNLAVLAAAVVCGALWTVLGSMDDIGAPLASHLVWTSLMLAWPPAAHRAMVST
jgi:membrane protease YdiL (CAAX protease family)